MQAPCANCDDSVCKSLLTLFSMSKSPQGTNGRVERNEYLKHPPILHPIKADAGERARGEGATLRHQCEKERVHAGDIERGVQHFLMCISARIGRQRLRAFDWSSRRPRQAEVYLSSRRPRRQLGRPDFAPTEPFTRFDSSSNDTAPLRLQQQPWASCETVGGLFGCIWVEN